MTLPVIVIATIASLIGWLVTSKFKDLDKKHNDHYAHATDMTLHETDRERDAKKIAGMRLDSEFLRHMDKDDERFDKMNDKLDKISASLEDVLKHVKRPNV